MNDMPNNWGWDNDPPTRDELERRLAIAKHDIERFNVLWRCAHWERDKAIMERAIERATRHAHDLVIQIRAM